MMNIVLTTSDNISIAMSYIGVILLIIILLGKVINVVKLGGFYEKLHIFTGFVIATISFFFIMVGYLTNYTIVFSAYMFFSSFLFLLIVGFTIIEILEMFISPSFRERLNNGGV